MVDREVTVHLSDGGEYHGRLVGHDEETATILNNEGAIAVLAKSTIVELRGNEDASDATQELGSVAVRSPRSPGESPIGFSRTRAYFHLSPGVASVFFDAPKAPLYTWGVGIGAFIRPAQGRFALSVGGAFEHLYRKIPSELDLDTGSVYGGKFNALRFVGELRIGGASSRVFAYGLARVGLGVYHSIIIKTSVKESEIVDRVVDYGGTGSVGGGVQWSPHKRISIGTEPVFDFDIFWGQADSVFPSFRARVFLGLLL